MSRTIDEKVVEMRFDNSDFEKNVSQSMSTLDKLKSALDFSGAEKSLSNVSDAIGKVSFGSLSGAVDEISGKFSALETVAIGALMNIGSKISDLAVNTVKGLTIDQVTAGFDKYADKTKSVQTIMNMTGDSIEEVNKQLEKLMWYSDETSYSFTDMTGNIAKFTSQGIDFDVATTAMMGISNWAGILGASKNEASRVMYNLSQALSTGYIRQADWRSVAMANMADEGFKKLAIDIAKAQGTLVEFVDQDLLMEVAQGMDRFTSISDMQTWVSKSADYIAQYSKGLMSLEEVSNNTGISVEKLQALLDKRLIYTAPVDENGNEILANEKTKEKLYVTAQQLESTLTKGKWFTNDVLLETLAQYGDYTEDLYDFYTAVTDAGFDVTTSELIGFVNDYKNGTLDLTEAMETTGMTAEELIPRLDKLSQSEYDLGRKAFAASQEARTFQDAIDATKDAVSSSFMTTFEILFGNYEEAKVIWTELANELWDIFAGPISDMNDMLTEWKDDFGGRDLFIQSIKDFYHGIRSYIDPITEAWEEIFPSIDAEQLYKMTEKVSEFAKGLILDDESMNKIRESFKGFFDLLKLIKDGVGEVISAFTGKAFGNTDDFFRWLLDSFYNVGTKLGEFVSKVREAKDALNKGIDPSEIIETYGEGIYKLADIFDKVVKSAESVGYLVSQFLDVRQLSYYYEQAGGGVAGITNIITKNIQKIIRTFDDLVKTWTGIDISGYTDKVRSLFELVASNIKNIQKSGVLSDIKDKLATIFDTFESRFGFILSWFKPVIDAGKSIWTDFVEGIKMLVGFDGSSVEGLFGVIKDGLDAIDHFIETSPELKTVIDTIKDSIKIFSDFASDFFSLSGTIETFRNAGGGFNGVLAVINDKLSSIFGFVSDIIERITGFDISGFGDTFLLVIEAIEEGFAHIGNYIAKLFGWEDNPFAEYLDNSSGAIDALWKKLSSFKLPEVSISGIIDGITSSLKNLWDRIATFNAPEVDVSWIFDNFGGVLEKFHGILEKISPFVMPALKLIGDLFYHIAHSFTELSLSDAIDIAKIAVAIYAIKSIADVIEQLSRTLKSLNMKIKASALSTIAGAILKLAGAAVAIGSIDADKIDGVITVLATAIGGLVAILIAMSKTKTSIINAISSFIVLLGLDIMIIAFAGAINMLIDPIKELSKLDWESLAKGIGGIVSLAGGLSLAAIGLAKLGGALTEFSISIGVFVLAAASLAALLVVLENMKWGTVVDGILKIVALLGSVGIIAEALALVASFIDKFTGGAKYTEFATALLEVSGAVLVLAAAIWVINQTDDYWGPLLELTAALIEITAVTALVAPFAKALDTLTASLVKLGTGLIKMALGLAILGVVKKIFGDSLDKFIDSGIDLIIQVADKITERMPEISSSAIRLVIAIFTEIGKALKEVDPEPFVDGAAAIGAILAAVFLINKGNFDLKAFMKAGGAVLGAVAILVEIIGALAAVGWAIHASEGEWWDIKSGITEFSEIAELIGTTFFSKFGILAAGIGGAILIVSGLEALFDKDNKKKKKGKSNKDNKFSAFIEALKDIALFIAEVAAVITEIFVAFAVIGWAIDSINKDAVLGGKHTVNELIESVGTTFKSLAKTIDIFSGSLIAAIGVLILTFASIEGNSKIDFDFRGALKDMAVWIFDIGAIIGEIFAIFATLGGIITSINEGFSFTGDPYTIESLIKTVGSTFTALSEVIDVFSGSLIGAIAGLLLVFSNTKLTVTGSALSSAAALVGEIGVIIAEIEGVFLAIGAIIEAINSLLSNSWYQVVDSNGDVLSVISFINSAGEVLVAIADFIGGAVGKLIGSLVGGIEEGLVEHAMQGYSKGIGYIITVLGSFDTDAIAQAQIGADAVKTLLESLSGEGGAIDWFTGSKSEQLDNLSEILPKFGGALKSYSENVDGINTQAIDDSKAAVDIVMQLMSAIPDNLSSSSTTTLWGLFTSKNDANGLENLADNLGNFGTAMKDYSKNIEGMNGDAVGNTEEAVKIVLALAGAATEAASSTEKSYLWGLFKESSDASGLSNITENLPSFGTAIKSFSVNIDGMKDNVVDNMAMAFGAMTYVSQMIGFSDNIDDFGKSLKDYYKNTKDIDLEKMNSLTVAISSLLNTISTLDDDIIIEKLEGLSSNILSEVTDLFENIYARMLEGLGTIVENLEADVRDPQGKATDLETVGRKFFSAFKRGMLDNDISDELGNKKNPILAGVEDMLNSIVSLTDESNKETNWIAKLNLVGSTLINAVINGMESVASKAIATRIGSDFGQGFADGINSKLPVVGDAASSLGNKATGRLSREIMVESPSKLTREIGEYFDEGFELGIEDGTESVEDTVTGFGKAILEAFRDILGIHSPSEESASDASNYVSGFLNTIKGLYEESKKTMTEFGGVINESFGSSLEGIWDQVKIAVESGASDSSIASLFESVGIDLGEAGKDGIIKGLFGSGKDSSSITDSIFEALGLNNSSDAFGSYAKGLEEGAEDVNFEELLYNICSGIMSGNSESDLNGFWEEAGVDHSLVWEDGWITGLQNSGVDGETILEEFLGKLSGYSDESASESGTSFVNQYSNAVKNSAPEAKNAGKILGQSLSNGAVDGYVECLTINAGSVTIVTAAEEYDIKTNSSYNSGQGFAKREIDGYIDYIKDNADTVSNVLNEHLSQEEFGYSASSALLDSYSDAAEEVMSVADYMKAVDALGEGLSMDEYWKYIKNSNTEYKKSYDALKSYEEKLRDADDVAVETLYTIDSIPYHLSGVKNSLEEYPEVLSDVVNSYSTSFKQIDDISKTASYENGQELAKNTLDGYTDYVEEHSEEISDAFQYSISDASSFSKLVIDPDAYSRKLKPMVESGEITYEEYLENMKKVTRDWAAYTSTTSSDASQEYADSALQTEQYMTDSIKEIGNVWVKLTKDEWTRVHENWEKFGDEWSNSVSVVVDDAGNAWLKMATSEWDWFQDHWQELLANAAISDAEIYNKNFTDALGNFGDQKAEGIGVSKVVNMDEERNWLADTYPDYADIMDMSASEQRRHQAQFYAEYANGLVNEIQEMRASGNIDMTRVKEIYDAAIQTQEAVKQLSNKIENINVVMDSGELVGAIAPSMDNELGKRTIYMKRGV